MKHKFTVYGCCVTRDIFNFLDNEIYTPNVTIGFSPISSIFSSGIKVDEEDVNVDRKYINRMVHHNITSQTLDVLKNADSDYFIFDLAEERFPLQDWQLGEDDSIVPVNWYTHRVGIQMKNNEKYKELNIANWRFVDEDIKTWMEALEKFCELVKSKFSQDKIIYIPLQQVDDVVDYEHLCMKSLTTNKFEYPEGIEHIKFRERQNKIIKQAEKIILEHIPECWIVPMPKGAFTSTTHHFGASSLHFDYSFYEYYAEAIKLIAKTRDDDDENEKKLARKILEFLRIRYENEFEKIRCMMEPKNKVYVQYVGSKEYKDIFDENDMLYLKNPICNVAVSTMLGRGLKVYKQDSVDLDLLNDANKTYMDMIMYGKSEWLVVDLISECTDKIMVNGIGEMMNNYGSGALSILEKKYQGKEIEINKYNSQDIENVKSRIREFIEKVSEKYVQEKIIINEAYFHDYYYDEYGNIIEYGMEIKEKNAFLRDIYQLVYSLIPNCKVIKMPRVASFHKEMPEYKTTEERVYYQSVLKAILKGDEREYMALSNEQRHRYKL